MPTVDDAEQTSAGDRCRHVEPRRREHLAPAAPCTNANWLHVMIKVRS